MGSARHSRELRVAGARTLTQCAVHATFTPLPLQRTRTAIPSHSIHDEMPMNTPRDLEKKFWKALKSDRTLMLGVDGVEDGHSRPLTALTENDEGGPIWFFIGKPNAVVNHLSQNRRAIAAFTSK